MQYSVCMKPDKKISRRNFLLALGGLTTLVASGLLLTRTKTEIPSGKGLITKINEKHKIRTFFDSPPKVIKIYSDKEADINQNKINQMVELSIEQLGGLNRFVKPTDRIVIKPNMGTVSSEVIKGINTSPEMIQAIIELLVKNNIKNKNITIAEGSGVSLPKSSLYNFEQYGLTEIADKYGVELVDIKKDDYIEFDIPENKLLKNIRISKTVFYSDVLIDSAVLKGYPFTQCCKNLMGIYPDEDKPKMHDNIPKKVVELANAVRPTICIVDGIYGSRYGNGRNVVSEKHNLILSSTDPLAIDSVGSDIWGYKENIDSLNLGYGKIIGLGEYSNIELIELEV